MKTKVTRRELFENLGRWGTLAVIASIVGKLGMGSLRRSSSGERPNICGGCPVLASCNLPGATRVKSTLDGPLPAGEKTVSERPGLCGFQRRV